MKQDTSVDPQLDRQRPLELLESLRKAMIRIAIVIAVLSVGGYFVAEPVLGFLQRLAGVKLVAYGLPEAFFSFITLGLALGLTATMPYALYMLIGILPSFYPNFSLKAFWAFWFAAVFLFALGVIFCLTITLPYGIQFLLSFETSQIAALISVKKFVSFCFWVIFGFGIIFELPLGMMMLARVGVVKAGKLAAYRRYALLAVFVVAAVLTPTPDIFNMMLMAVPLYLLFEIGLLGMRFSQKSNK